MKDEEIKNTKLSDVRSGLTHKGKVRAAVLLGGGGKVDEVIADLGNSILQVNPSAFCICLDSAKTKTPYDWCSQFARNLRTVDGVPMADLAKFALTTGKSLSPFKGIRNEDSEPSSDNKIAVELVKNFEALTQAGPNGNNTPHIVLAIKDFSDYTAKMLSWLSDALNPAIRESKFFQGCRFLFSMKRLTERESSFFNSFGFEKIHLVEIEPVDNQKDVGNEWKSDSSELVISTSDAQEETSHNITFPKSLKKKDLSLSLNIENNLIGSMDIKEASKLLSSFSEIEKEYLYISSYPTRISRYSLEHFESDRQAALSFNWLKRSKTLHTAHPSGDLILADELKLAARTLHAHEHPELSEKWRTLASVLDRFQEIFPIDSTHWIPINLQLLDSFDSRILGKLFTGDRLDSVLNLIEQTPEQIIEKGSKLSLSEEAKIVTRRYMELSGLSLLDGIEEHVRELWLKDRDNYNLKKAQMEEERTSVISEIEGTLSQVANLKDLKDNLNEDSRNPNRKKAEKIYTFTSSKVLIFIGIATIGASLLSDNIGSYHAACGLALTLFGFFWPNVEFKRATITGVGQRSSLAIETQERSLNHRIGSLSNRVQVMKGNLDAVQSQLAKLGDTPPDPYLEAQGE